MEAVKNSNLLKLLKDLSKLLQNLEMPALLDLLNHSDLIPALRDQVNLNQHKNQTLLQRMDVSVSSNNLKRLWSPSKEAKPRKRTRSPQFSVSSGRMLMSQLLNHEGKQPLTPTSWKSSPFSPPSTTQVQEGLDQLGHNQKVNRHLPTPPTLF